MKISELEKRVSLKDIAEEDYKLQRIGNSYRINPCPLCGHKDHFTINPPENMWSTFANCHSDVRGGSVYKYLLIVRGLSEPDARAKLHELAEVEPDADYSLNLNEKKTPAAEELQEPNKINLTKYITELYQNQSEDDKKYFFNERGIDPQLVNKYKMSVYKDDTGKRRAMLPIWQDGEVVGHTMRAMDGQEPKYLKSTGSSKCSNMDYLSERHDEPIFITEGYFDALALESRGFKAISINSASNILNVMSDFKRLNVHNNNLIAAFDNDKAGRDATVSSKLNSINIPAEYNDLAEWGKAEIDRKTTHSDTMQNIIKSQVAQMSKPDNVADYLKQGFHDEIAHMAESKDRKTGFASLDAKMGGLYNGLYVIGGGSGVGKTTLTHQIGDSLVEQGEHVIFFSLEQSKMEIVSKSISRASAIENLNSAVTSLQVRKGYQNESITNAINKYSRVAERMNVIEGNLSTSTATIREKVQSYQNFNNVSPVVIVDYLQILQAPENTFNMNDKKRIDDSVSELKRISRDFGIVVIVISSFNRTSYYSQVGFDSFKESGGIEYTADVVLGLQYEIMSDDLFLSEKKLGEKRAKLAEVKAESPRQVEIVCLKNRFGMDYTQSFSYFAKYDYFEENRSESFSYTFPSEGFASGKTKKQKEYNEKDLGGGVKEIVPEKRLRL